MYFLDKKKNCTKAIMDLENMSTSVAILELIEEITNANWWLQVLQLVLYWPEKGLLRGWS